ncbi:MAG: Ig-like domain-containing protein, partial [Cystobacter sp.]
AASHLAVGAGVAVAASASELRTFELPYPTLSGQQPLPGGALPWGAAVSVTLADRLPPSVAQGTGLELVGSGGAIAGTRSVQGSAVLFQPSAPLMPGEPVLARVTFAATPYVGGTVGAPWTWSVLPAAEAGALRVDSLLPGHGDIAGGYPLVLRGLGFDARTQVRLGTQVASVVPPVTADRLEVLVPASPWPGPVRVRVSQGPEATPVDVPGGFVYVAPLSLSRVTPSRVDLSGGTVTVEGSGFNRGLVARLGGLVASTSDFTPTRFKLRVPPGPDGWLELEVTQAGSPPVVLAQAVLRADSDPPRVTAWDPMDTVGNSQVPLNSVFTLRFNEPLDPATAPRIRLVRKNGTVPEPGTFTVGGDALSVSFTPASPLPSTTAFVLSAVGVADRYGNAIVDSEAARREFTSRDVVPPSVYLRLENSTQPLAQGSLLAAEVDWPLRVVSSDDSGSLSSVQLWVDGVAVSVNWEGRATYRWPASMRAQTSTLRVRAVDGAGNATESQVTVQVVDDMPPTVDLTQPSTSTVQVEQGTALTVALSASDNHGLSVVELRLDGVVVKRASGLSGTTATLTHPLRLDAPGEHVLSALAIDDRGQISTSRTVGLQVIPDTIPPQVTWLVPGVGARLVGGGRHSPRVYATDANGVSSVSFWVEGAPLGTRMAPPWTVDWIPPIVTQETALVLEARARDPHGNESTVSLPVTVVPVSTPRPSIALLNPRNATYPQGFDITLQAQVSSEIAVARVRLALGASEVKLTQPPWQHTFRAPRLELAPGVILARAAVWDVLGREGVPDVMEVAIREEGVDGPEPLLQPRGPTWLGGSALRAHTEDGRTVSGIVARVGNTRLVAGASGGYTLPLGPDGAPVSLSAALDAPDDGWMFAEKTGALTAFAQGPVRRMAATDEPVVGLSARSGWMLVLREVGGGRARVELLDAVTQEKVAERVLEGFGAAVSLDRGRAVVALRTGSRGRLEVLALPTLEPVASWPVSRVPRALEPVGSGLAVGTDEGLELWNEAGQVAARLGLGEVQGLSSDGERLAVLAGGRLHEVDVQVPHAPELRASVAAPEGTVVAALAGGRRCVMGDTARCFQSVDASLEPLGETRLPGPASSAEAMGPWLLVGTDQGLSVVDVRAVPATAGHYREAKGLVRATGGSILAAARGEVSRLELQRGASPLTVRLGLPASAAPGARVALGASVEGLTDSRDGYEVELRVDGTVVQVLDGRLPMFVDLPRSGTKARVGLRVVDLAGRVSSSEGEVLLVEEGTGPGLLAVRTRGEVTSGGLLTVAAVAAEPVRVVGVEYAVDGMVAGIAHAPALAMELRAPEVWVDTPVTVSAVALDERGRRGPAVTSEVLVRPGSLPAMGLSLARVGTGPILEGSWVRVRATLAPLPASAEVRFRLEGVEFQRVGLPPYEALLRMPVGTGSRSLQVEAVAVEGDGRESAPALLNLTVVDDLTPPVVSLSVDPSGTLVAAGSEVRASISVTDGAELESWSLRATIAGEQVASGGSQLGFTVPASASPGAEVEVVATAKDVAGNTSVARARRVVVSGVLSGGGSVTGGAFAGALRLVRVGQTVYVATPSGLAIGGLSQDAVPRIEPLGFLPTDSVPTALAVRGGLAVLGLSGRQLWVVDVSDPTYLRRVGSLAGVSIPEASAGDEFYVVADHMPSQVDLGTPSSPSLSSIGGSSLLSGVQDGVARASSDGSFVVRTVNRDGARESLSGPRLTGEPRYARWHDGLLLAGTDRSLAVLVREGSELRLGAEVPLPAGVRALAAAGGRVWVACEDDRLRVVDVRDPSTPRVIASEALAASGVEVSGGVLIASTPEGLVTRRLPVQGASDAALAVQVGSVPLDDAARGLTAFRRGVLVAAGLTGAQGVSLEDPSRPERIRQVVAGLALRQVERTGQDVFTLDGQSLAVGVERVDWRIERDTTRTSRLVALGNTERFAVSPRRLWTASGGKVSTVALPEADAPASLLLGSATVDISGDESLAVVALGASGAAVVGVDAAGTLWRASLVADAHADAVALEGTLAVLGGPSGLAIVDVSDVSAPVRRASVPTAGPVRRVRLAGRLALVSEGMAGVELWDLTVPGAPVLRATLPTPRAEDAILAAGHVVVADGLGGVKVFPLPSAAIAPGVRLLPGVEALEPGAALEVAAVTSGVGLDDAELLLDGQVLQLLDAAAPRARFRVPSQEVLGRELSFQVRVRSATGAQALSAPRRVRVVRFSELPPAPQLTLHNPSPSGVTSVASAAMLYFHVNRSGGLEPSSLRARWAGHELGPLSLNYYGEGFVRMPVVAADTTAPFEVVFTDAAGRSLTRSAQVMVRAPGTTAPTAPTGLPSALYAAPYSNAMQLRATGSVAFSLRLEVNGVQVGRAHSDSEGALNLTSNVVLPPSSPAGAQVTLVAVAEDILGRQTRTERVYTVQPDDWTPSVSLSNLYAPIIERTTRNVSASAQHVPGHKPRSLRLFANGVELATTTGASVSAPYTFADVAQVAQVTFEAVARDHLGREARTSSTVNVQPDMPPQANAWVEEGAPLLTGSQFRVCGWAEDDVRVTRSRLLLGTEVLWECNSDYYPCSTSGICFRHTVPLTASSVEVSMEATDSSGQTSVHHKSYPVTQDQPPVVQVSVAHEPLVQGEPFQACVNASDDVGLSSVRLKVGEAIVWQCSGSACAQTTQCVAATAPQSDRVVLSAEVTDTSARTTTASREYAVQVDQRPSVRVWASREPLIRGAPFEACVNASDDVNLTGLRLKVGETVVWQCSGPACARETTHCVEATAPEADSVVLSAEATDTSSRTSTASRDYTLQADQPPEVEPWVEGKPLISGFSYAVCAKAVDDVLVSSVRLKVGEEVVWECNGSCSTWRKCVNRTVPTAADVQVRVEATDSRGQTTVQGKRYTIEPNPPPVVSAWVTPEPLVQGQPLQVCVTATDETQVSSLTLRLGDEVVWNCSGTCSSPTPRCFDRTTPIAASVEVSAEATDQIGGRAVSTRTYPIDLGPPPTVEVKLVGELIEGRPYQACVRAHDNLPVSRMALAVDGQTVWSCNGECPMDQDVCVNLVGPRAASLVLGAEVVDVDQQVSTDTREYPVQEDLEPPTVEVIDYYELLPPDFLIAGTQNNNAFVVVASDDSHLRSVELSIGGTVASRWVMDGSAPVTSGWFGVDSPFVPASPGQVELRAVAEDGVGQQASVSMTRPVLEPGAGLSCERAFSPLQVNALSLEHFPRAPEVISSESLCSWNNDGPSRGVWQKLPFDGPVEHLLIESWSYSYPGVVGLRDGCDPDAVVRCAAHEGEGDNHYFLEAGPLSAEARLFVSRGKQSSFRIASALLGNGARCEPDSTAFVCKWGLCQPQATGEHRCVAQACGDSVDNDGDGRVDYPEDPGCSGLLDNDERDPPGSPACSNGVDDDGDGLVDWPEDPGCASGSGPTESGDGESCQAPVEIVQASTPLQFEASTDDEVLVCGGETARPDRVLALRMPGQGQVAISGQGLTGLALREYCAHAAGDLGCSNSVAFHSQLSSGTYFVVAEGVASGTLEVSGTLLADERCDPAQPWIACPFPQACAASAQGFSCQVQACANGVDDDGDGVADFPLDPGCDSWWDGTEEDPVIVLPACRNGLDDDGDGLTDWPLEPGCASP